MVIFCLFFFFFGYSCFLGVGKLRRSAGFHLRGTCGHISSRCCWHLPRTLHWTDASQVSKRRSSFWNKISRQMKETGTGVMKGRSTMNGSRADRVDVAPRGFTLVLSLHFHSSWCPCGLPAPRSQVFPLYSSAPTFLAFLDEKAVVFFLQLCIGIYPLNNVSGPGKSEFPNPMSVLVVGWAAGPEEFLAVSNSNLSIPTILELVMTECWLDEMPTLSFTYEIKSDSPTGQSHLSPRNPKVD